jgi:tetratricopeptide (TPR) repeat protein
MTIRPLNCRLPGWVVPVLVLLVGCSQETQSPRSRVVAESGDRTCESDLQVCDDPQLESLQADPAQSTLPVAYPANELDHPLLLARPFPLADPQLPIPRSSPLPSVTGAVKSGSVPPVETGPFLAPPTDAIPAEPPDGSAPRDTPNIAPPEPLPAVATNKNEAPLNTPKIQPPSARTPPAGAVSPGLLNPQMRPASGIPGTVPRTYRQSDAMRAVTLQASQTIRRGYYLAERGALYSARAEFIQALRTIAQALDIQSGTRDRAQALAAGLAALDEAQDFLPEGSHLEADVDVAVLVKAHQTPICKALNVQQLTPVVVLQHYYTYAQQHLAIAAGREEAASMALFGLGKTYATLAIEKSMQSAVAEPTAMVFHRAALSAHSGNFLAANELAVLEARWGQNAAARSLLQYSLAIAPHSIVWRNLAVVHQRLDETTLADLALHEAQLAARREATAKPGNPEGIVPSADVEWLDSKEFAATSRTEIDVQKPAAAVDGKSGVQATPVVAPAPPRQRSAAGWWFPWFR